jgi:hypothetical protein
MNIQLDIYSRFWDFVLIRVAHIYSCKNGRGKQALRTLSLCVPARLYSSQFNMSNMLQTLISVD